MGVSSAAELLNLVGVLTGAALCAMLLALVLRGRAGGDRDDRLPLLTALLGLVWNLGELADDLLSRAGIITARRRGSTSSRSRRWPCWRRWSCTRWPAACAHGRAITAVAYACAIGAVAVHVRAVAAGELRPSPVAFAPADGGVRRHQRAAGHRHAPPDQRTSRAVDAGPGALRGLGESRRPLPRRGRRLAGRAARPQRGAAAGVRDPLPGVPLRAGRPVPQAGADAAGGRRDGDGRLRRRRRRAAGLAGGRPAARRLGAHRGALPVAAPRGVDASSTRRCSAARTTAGCAPS